MNTLSIVLIGYEGKRVLPASKAPITAFHVNGGVTWWNDMMLDARVLVYRREEIIKVLTHELIHAFNLDEKHIERKHEEWFNSHFGIRCKSITLNESFTDALAVLINTVVYSRVSNTDVHANLRREIRHMVKTAATVLNHLGYQKIGNKLKIPGQVCENTHVTSYYVLKAAVFSDVGNFMELLSSNRMCINVEKYTAFLRAAIGHFEQKIDLNVIKTEKLKMTCLDIAENYIKLRSI